MGCSSSSPEDPNNNLAKPGKKNRGDYPELRQEPEIEDVNVPDSEPGYPPPRPPKNKKADVFQMKAMTKIDTLARETPLEKMKTFEDLVRYLKSGCSSDLEKLRAVFVWLGNQDVDSGNYSDVTDSDTPRGFLKLIRDRRASYSSLFATLCRKMGLPCVIIHGYGKSANYEVGDSDENVKLLNNHWTAVHVTGDWRIVFPLWACRALVGHSTGAYTKVESKGQAVREKEEESSGKTVTQLNEYYFLTDPEDFVYDAMAKDRKWQLLERPWTLEKFADVPYFQQHYFNYLKEDIKITSKFSCRLKTRDGECHVELSCDGANDMSMDYELYYNHKESGKDISSSLQLNNFVFLNRTGTTWNFGIRFPETGVYKFEVHGGRRVEAHLCYFKINCDEVQVDCQPYPVNPGKIGYGPSRDTEDAGVVAKSHKNGLVKITAFKRQEFHFSLTKTLIMRTELVHNTIPSSELQQYVKQTQTNSKLTVQVTVPEQGEFALQMHAQKKGEASFNNVCNYLLTSKSEKKKRLRTYENPVEKRARNNIQTLAKSQGTRDISDLERAVEKFEKLDIDDKGDLTQAQDSLEYKKTKKELRDAINRRHYETLETAIKHGKESRFCDKLSEPIKEAETVRDHLKHLNRIAHDVLEMKQSTIAELRSYKIPKPIIKDVMQATFLMLGEKRRNTEEWEDLQILMGKQGKEGLLRRVRQFDTVNVTPETQQAVDELITDYDETDVRLASAGAGTFYKWLKNVSGVLSKEDEPGKENEPDESDANE